MTRVSAGFLPLMDAAILIAAARLGFAEKEGIDLHLMRDASWANIRDRIAIGHFDAAHMLAPMPIAANLGLGPLPGRLAAPFAMGLGGNAICVSGELSDMMAQDDDAAGFSINDASLSGRRLAEALKRRLSSGRSTRFAVVHSHSGHNLELRYFMAASGIDPDHDVDIVIVPPSYMPDALTSGRIDGFCVGEPWSNVAVARGVGHVIATKNAIWRSSPEKVLAVREALVDDDPGLVHALIRALYRAAVWCDLPENHEELARLLSEPNHIDVPAAILMESLAGRFGSGNESGNPDFFITDRRAATFPWRSHALWLYSQMVRWGLLEHTTANARTANATYRPDLYRAALAETDALLPASDAKVEGALTEARELPAADGRPLIIGPDGFMDGRIFDPARLDDYIASQSRSLR
ncbi:CmpA/NrtA family ABC transporter substrate-binding protein [Notoacmeibacter sp. MSK16QG-6]|uniref:CmpA/NrtA family ABC transporter substrate-binding protein n=1 Tax=Notoacmeibacter sp. MSK16QG-6 TaxID=2957982 RepID=UPI0020A1FFBF|nr:CmpA/NrtA family ABC transporter substrate-binding protein [Notoacmeibacter sp. MSK16QG-6]MCP1199677.1 ABC transporter substrate-binding protein [Notoacmeibacter sp. MSK16QG-6]